MIEIPPGTTGAASLVQTTRFKLGRLGPFLLIGQLGWALPGAASGTLLQAIAADIDPHNKLTIYTIWLVIGALTSIAGTVVGGALSDRTRSRLGKRSPWLLGAAILAAVALILVGLTTNVIVIAIGYGLFQAGIGTWVAALSALIPDRVPNRAVGRASAFAGFGYLLGQTIGGVIGGAFVTRPAPGFIAIPWIMVIAAILIAVFIRGKGNDQDVVGTPSVVVGAVLPGARDFVLAFAGRFFFILAIVMLSTFQLYTLTDYLGQSTAKAGGVISLATLIFGVLAVVGVVVSGPLSDRIGRRKPFVTGAPLLIGVALIPLLLAPSVTTYIVFYSLTGLAFGIYISVDQALMVAVLPKQSSAARDLGVLSIAQTIPGVVAPLLGYALVASLGYTGIFWTSLAAAVLAAIAIIGIRSVR